MCEGLDIGEVSKVWIRLAKSEMRLELLKELIKHDLGLNDVQDYYSDLKLKLRSTALKENNDSEKKLVRENMQLKLHDERKFNQELLTDRNNWRREITRLLIGHPSKERSVVRFLREQATMEKKTTREKYRTNYESNWDNVGAFGK